MRKSETVVNFNTRQTKVVKTRPIISEPLESTITADIMKRLRAFGGVWSKIHGGPMQTTGLPDIVGCYRGRFVGFEVKRPSTRNNVSGRQRFMLSILKDAGAITGVVVSAHEAITILKDEFNLKTPEKL